MSFVVVVERGTERKTSGQNSRKIEQGQISGEIEELGFTRVGTQTRVNGGSRAQ